MDELEIDFLLLEMEANGLIKMERDKDGALYLTVTEAGRSRAAEIDALLPPCTCGDCDE